MGYRVKYEYIGKRDYAHVGKWDYAHVEGCANIMDAMFKFYNHYGMDYEILIIEKW